MNIKIVVMYKSNISFRASMSSYLMAVAYLVTVNSRSQTANKYWMTLFLTERSVVNRHTGVRTTWGKSDVASTLFPDTLTGAIFFFYFSWFPLLILPKDCGYPLTSCGYHGGGGHVCVPRNKGTVARNPNFARGAGDLWRRCTIRGYDGSRSWGR